MTYFVVNDKKKEFWKFYKTCCSQINSLQAKKHTNERVEQIKHYLKNHLKQSIAMAVSLKPLFLLKERSLLYKRFAKLKDGLDIWEIQETTNAFRRSNLI